MFETQNGRLSWNVALTPRVKTVALNWYLIEFAIYHLPFHREINCLQDLIQPFVAFLIAFKTHRLHSVRVAVRLHAVLQPWEFDSLLSSIISPAGTWLIRSLRLKAVGLHHSIFSSNLSRYRRFLQDSSGQIKAIALPYIHFIPGNRGK